MEGVLGQDPSPPTILQPLMRPEKNGGFGAIGAGRVQHGFDGDVVFNKFLALSSTDARKQEDADAGFSVHMALTEVEVQTRFSLLLPGSMPRVRGVLLVPGGLVILMDAAKASLEQLAFSLDEDAVRFVAKRLMLLVHLLQLYGAKYGDIKLPNILVTEEGQVMLGDLGCAEWFGPDEECKLYSGTQDYWASEVAARLERRPARDDEGSESMGSRFASEAASESEAMPPAAGAGIPVTWRADIHSIGVAFRLLMECRSGVHFSQEALTLMRRMTHVLPCCRPTWEDPAFQRWARVRGDEVQLAHEGVWDAPTPSFLRAAGRIRGLFG